MNLEHYSRVVKWNAARYDREYDHALQLSLLREEYKEWLEATTEVDKLDALMDIAFVAMGAIWKANIRSEVMEEAFNDAQSIMMNHINNNEYWPGYYIGTHLDVMEYCEDYPVAHSLATIMVTAFTEATGLGLSHDQVMKAFGAVCTSNESKSVTKTASDTKANAGDKGEYYTAPEPVLQEILNERAIG